MMIPIRTMNWSRWRIRREMLLDDELLENNPRDQYLSDLKADIEDYPQQIKNDSQQ